MCYRAIPLAATGESPAQLMMGCQIRTTVPMLEEKLKPKWISHRSVENKDRKAKETYKGFFNWRHSARALPELQSGQCVKVKLDDEKGWRTPDTVKSKPAEPRSYVVQTEDGTTLHRNRRHLQLVPSFQGENDARQNHSDCEAPQPTAAAEPEESATTPFNPPLSATAPSPPATPQLKVRTTSSGRIVKTPLRYRDS
ncbi:UNVERIFIED_CONTAM: hypothetical protein FKN15_064112 [Acipenser sinensis]